LIVDDEPIICRGLKETIQWEQYDIEIVGTACDGRQAVEFIQSQPYVDIVITDIRMPNMDGLELASYIYENHSSIRIIIISGYDDFEYAQKAIKLGVKDYLLKPVDIDELVNKVSKITSEIETEKRKNKQLLQSQLKTMVMQQIAHKPLKFEDIQKYKEIKIYPFVSLLKDYGHQVRQLATDDINELKRRWMSFIEKTVQNDCRFDCFSFFAEENILLTCIFSDESKINVMDLVDRLQDNLTKENYSLLLIFSDGFVEIGSMEKKYTKLKSALSYMILENRESIILSSQNTIKQEYREYPFDLEKKLINTIFSNEKSDFTALTDTLFTYFIDQKFSLEEAVQVCTEIVRKMIIHYESLVEKGPMYFKLNYLEPINIYTYNSYQVLKELLDEDLATFINQLGLKRADPNDWIIQRAKEYISKYYKTNIKANEVADAVNISPNYFSTLFKLKTGKSFTNYVNDLRIREAKTLLAETPFRISEIAKIVGFQEYKYFVEVFKRHTRMTPSEYRILYSHNESQKKNGG